jgi:hypothetical protein
MKRKFTSFILLFALTFTACIKMVIPIPPPPGGSSSSSGAPTGNIPYGVSMVLNGKYLTFNSGASLDTSDNQIYVSGWGDSAGYTNLNLALGAQKADNAPMNTGVYPSSGDLEENQSNFTIYDWGFNGVNFVGFGAYPDTVTIVTITDTTVTGTFQGTCEAKYQDQIDPNLWHDSIMNVANGKFYLHK